MTRTIDMTPTWEYAMKIHIMVLEDGTETGKQAAREEIFRVARVMDRLNTAIRDVPELRTILAERGIFDEGQKS